VEQLDVLLDLMGGAKLTNYTLTLSITLSLNITHNPLEIELDVIWICTSEHHILCTVKFN